MKRLLVALLLSLTACAGGLPEPAYEAPDYSYLPKVKLNVASIEIQDSWAARGTSGHLEQTAPVQPRDALSRMGSDRLVTGGNSGKAVFTITDASILHGAASYNAHFAVTIKFSNDAGDALGEVPIEVTRRAPVQDDTEASVRIALYNLVRETMSDMNVELEFQLRRKMKDLLQTTSPSAPPPGVVQSEDLGTPDKPVGVLKAPTP